MLHRLIKPQSWKKCFDFHQISSSLQKRPITQNSQINFFTITAQPRYSRGKGCCFHGLKSNSLTATAKSRHLSGISAKPSQVRKSLLTFIQNVKDDPGSMVLHAGAVISLSGFMMSDVMALRCLSIVGSTCGMVYNFSRKPRQINAVMWGLVFISVNTYHLYYLYLERTEDMTFDANEMQVYTSHFKDWGVEPWQFKKLVKGAGCSFEHVNKGDVIVKPMHPLDDVILVVKGELGAEDPLKEPGLAPPIYTYRGDARNGCIIGGTALVDSSVRQKAYPNRIIALKKSLIVKWNTDNLIRVMHKDKDIESAMLHTLYVELIQNLRRGREEKNKNRNHYLHVQDALNEYEKMVSNAIRKSENTGGQLLPRDKKEIRVFGFNNRLTISQRETILKRFGWTISDWEDGEKSTTAPDKS